MAKKRTTPATAASGLAKFSEQPAWLQAAAVGVVGLFTFRLIDGGLSDLFSLPDRVTHVEARADDADKSLKGIGSQLERLIAVQERLEADRIKREAAAAEDARRQLIQAGEEAKKRDEERAQFWKAERERDRENLRQTIRETVGTKPKE